MRKSGFIFLAFVLLFSGCGKAVPKIDDYTWEMTTVQSVEKDGQVIACGKDEGGGLGDALPVELLCTAEAGMITIRDETNGQVYNGGYSVTEDNPDSVIYQVTVGESNGVAVTALTTYHGGDTRSTLIMRFGDYTLNFMA